MIYGYLDPKFKRSRVARLTELAGGKTLEYTDPIPEDATAVIQTGVMRGGGELYREVQKRGIDHYYMDNGYWGKRKEFFRLTKNGWTNSNIIDRPSDRAPNMTMKEWNEEGEYVLVIEHKDGNMISALPESEWWYQETLKQLHEMGHKVKVRKRPQKHLKGVGLEEDLAGAYMVVANASNIMIQAMLAGKRVWCAPEGPLHQLSGEIGYDRQRVINHLSYSHFTEEELYNGYAWRIINDL